MLTQSRAKFLTLRKETDLTKKAGWELASERRGQGRQGRGQPAEHSDPPLLGEKAAGQRSRSWKDPGF